MIDSTIAFLAPHLCSGCGFEGSLLCYSCKNNILDEPFSMCVACGNDLAGQNGICSKCVVSYDRAWCVADRRDSLQRLIGSFKFTNAKVAYKPLADLLEEHLPQLPVNTVIIPVPTVSKHIRQRGYDHMLLISRQLAKIRNLPLETSLQRVTLTQQRSSGRAERIAQAKLAFVCKGKLDSKKIYLLVDDVVTTGATVKYAAQTLKDAGAKNVWVASISRQPLDQQGLI